MNKSNIHVIALAIGFAFSAGAMAAGTSKDDYQAGKDSIAADYKSAKAGCESLSGNLNDICEAEATGKKKIAMAELEVSYKPGRENRYALSVAKAEANYAVANERCDDLAGNIKDVCVQEAKAAQTTAKADAEVQLKTSDANATASGKSAAARSKAGEQAADARHDATEAKREAEYKVAEERCDGFAGGAKDECLMQAKAQFGK